MRIPASASACAVVYEPPLAVSRLEKKISPLTTLVRNLPPKAVAWSAGAVALKSFLSADVLNTVLIAGRPIWSALRQVLPSFQLVVAQTPIATGRSRFGMDRTMAFV